METVISIAVLVAIFIIVALFLSKKWQGAYLDKIELMPDETVIFNDQHASIELKAGVGIDVLPGAYVRFTNQRIIIAQKTLGRDKYITKYIINYTGTPSPEGMGGGSMKTGYITYKTLPEKISITDEPKPKINIEPLDKGISIPEWLTIETDLIDTYREALKI